MKRRLFMRNAGLAGAAATIPAVLPAIQRKRRPIDKMCQTVYRSLRDDFKARYGVDAERYARTGYFQGEMEAMVVGHSNYPQLLGTIYSPDRAEPPIWFHRGEPPPTRERLDDDLCLFAEWKLPPSLTSARVKGLKT